MGGSTALNLDAVQQVKLIGVLSGDVDGSWAQI